MIDPQKPNLPWLHWWASKEWTQRLSHTENSPALKPIEESYFREDRKWEGREKGMVLSRVDRILDSEYGVCTYLTDQHNSFKNNIVHCIEEEVWLCIWYPCCARPVLLLPAFWDAVIMLIWTQFYKKMGIHVNKYYRKLLNQEGWLISLLHIAVVGEINTLCSG